MPPQFLALPSSARQICVLYTMHLDSDDSAPFCNAVPYQTGGICCSPRSTSLDTCIQQLSTPAAAYRKKWLTTFTGAGTQLHAVLWSSIRLGTLPAADKWKVHLPGCAGSAEMMRVLNIRRNPDLNRKTYEEVTGILKSIRSLQFLRVDINPEFGLPELTAEVGASN
jgi:hypothetical protein